jgi:2-dehydrotetronate isomerase
MFQEIDLPERFFAAQQCGFQAVEFLWPYAWPVDDIHHWLQDNNLELVLVNTPPGEGEMGLAAIPGKEETFQQQFRMTLDYASRLGASMIHLMAGQDSESVKASESLFIEHVRWASDLARSSSIAILLEPLNTRDAPGYLHTRIDHTARLIDDIGRDNVKLQFDFYHRQLMEGDLATNLKRHFDIIGHVQFSSLPGRHEPQFGEVNMPYLFDYLDELGYTGWIGCEYSAKEDTRQGLVWGTAYGLGSSSTPEPLT